MSYGFKRITDEERELLKNVELPVSEEALGKLMFTLEADYHANDEWDQPAYLYVIVGDVSDPYFIKVCEAHPHPAAFLQGAWDEGLRFQDDVLGLAFAHEGWRHLNYEEAIKAVPELMKPLAFGAELAFPDMDDEERETEIRKAYMNVVTERFPPPSEMPDHLRGESRHVTLTFRNGTTTGVMRERGQDEASLMQAAPWEIAKVGRVASFIYQMLHNQRPEMHPGEVLNKES